jgi:hypothetical protein
MHYPGDQKVPTCGENNPPLHPAGLPADPNDLPVRGFPVRIKLEDSFEHACIIIRPSFINEKIRVQFNLAGRPAENHGS